MKKVESKSKKKVSMDELFKCLSFYADKENYINDQFSEIVANDRGSKARKILRRLLLDTLNKSGIDYKELKDLEEDLTITTLKGINKRKGNI